VGGAACRRKAVPDLTYWIDELTNWRTDELSIESPYYRQFDSVGEISLYTADGIIYVGAQNPESDLEPNLAPSCAIDHLWKVCLISLTLM
jgi:hypothetical protein